MTRTSEPNTARNSQSAWALHTRLQAATRRARAQSSCVETIDATTATHQAPSRPRYGPGAPWALLETLQVSRGDLDPSLSMDHALRQILIGLLATDAAPDLPCDLAEIDAPILIVRSGPWSVLRSLIDALAERTHCQPISVLCHRRDADDIARMAQEIGITLEPLFYPRFEPFVTATLRRLLEDGTWASTVVLDASKYGRGHALEHVITAVTFGKRYVWNGSGQAFRQRSLRERLGREKYALVRGLLRWRATER